MAINKITTEKELAIRRKSAASAPTRPSSMGMTASDVKAIFYGPMMDDTDSIKSEINRIVDEANGILTPLSATVAALDEEYDNAYVLDAETTPSSIAFVMGKDKTFAVAAGSSLSVSAPAMAQGNRAGLNWTMPVPGTVTVSNATGHTLVVRGEHGVHQSIANGSSASITLSYASNVAAVKVQSVVYCDGVECVMLVTRVHNVTL